MIIKKEKLPLLKKFIKEDLEKPYRKWMDKFSLNMFNFEETYKEFRENFEKDFVVGKLDKFIDPKSINIYSIDIVLTNLIGDDNYINLLLEMVFRIIRRDVRFTSAEFGSNVNLYVIYSVPFDNISSSILIPRIED